MLRFVVFILSISLIRADTIECAVCEKAATILQNKTDVITADLLKLCAKLNSTTHRLECNAAVKTVVSFISSETPEQLCEKVHLCNGTEVSEYEIATRLVELEMPSSVSLPRDPLFDLCPLCEKAMGYLKNETGVIVEKALQYCATLNTTTHRLECKAAVETAASFINGETAEQLCEKIKLCNGTDLSDFELTTRLAETVLPLPLLTIEEPQVDLCPLCEKAMTAVQSHSQEIETYLKSLCAKLNSTVEKLACDTAVQKVVNVLNSQTAEQLCAEVHLCSNSTYTTDYSLCGACEDTFKVARKYPDMLNSIDCEQHSDVPTCTLLKWKGRYLLENSAPDAACVDLGLCPKGWISGVW